MSSFLKNILSFSLPFLMVFVVIENTVRDNSFQARCDYIEAHKREIELMFLGPSHTKRAINPEYLNQSSAFLTHAGAPINISYKLFQNFTPKLPNLKYVFIDVSYPVMEYQQTSSWEKNHLFLIYYGINNYGKRPPLSEYFLLTSNPKAYTWRFIRKLFFGEKIEYNEFGFVLKNRSEFKSMNYDTTLIIQNFEPTHQHEDQASFKKNVILIDQIISQCLEKGIKIILFAPPSYHLYNEARNKNMLKRRDAYLKKHENTPNVFIWKHEKEYEYNPYYFDNSDHMSPFGAIAFTKKIKEKLILLGD